METVPIVEPTTPEPIRVEVDPQPEVIPGGAGRRTRAAPAHAAAGDDDLVRGRIDRHERRRETDRRGGRAGMRPSSTHSDRSRCRSSRDFIKWDPDNPSASAQTGPG